MILKKYIVTSKSTEKLGHTYIQWLIALLGSSMFIGYGFQIGWVSPMKNILQSDASPTSSPLTDIEMSFVASSAVLAAVFSTPVLLYIADFYGRKTALFLMLSVHALSWIIKLSATYTEALILARICGGFMCGGCYSIVPMYVREISQDTIRAKLVSLSLSCQYIGVLGMFAMGSYLGYYTTMWIALSISIVTISLTLLAPESPMFLIKTGKFDVAAQTVATLRGLDIDDIDVQNEINYMKNEDSYYKSIEKITFIAIFKNKAWRRGYIICQMITLCVAFNGTFGIVTYALSIMIQAGVTVSPQLLSLLVPILMQFGALVPMACVENMGRKRLLGGTFLLSSVSLVCLASALLVQQCGVSVPSWIHVVTIGITVFAYSAGVMPVPNVIINEVFKFQVRGKLIACIQTAIWVMLAILVIFFDLASRTLGLYSVFYVCAGVNLLGALVVFAFLPETKGRTTDEIEAILAGQKSNRDIMDSS